MDTRANRRARTNSVVKDNHIFAIYRKVNQRPAGVVTAYYRRKFWSGEVYTGLMFE